MATTSSIVTAVSSATFNAWLADDGAVGRIRQGQTAVCTAFGNLSIPAGARIDGIELIMEGYSTHGSADEDCFSVSYDGGTTFSTEQDITTGLWSTSSGAHQVEIAGGISELWGMTWNATTAAAIQVQVKVDEIGHGFYLDYFSVRITYTETRQVTINAPLTVNGNLTIK